MDRSDEDFSNLDLSGSDLSDSTFYRANFLNANTWNCDFRNSDLTGARNFSEAQLAATDLTNAKLPEEMAKFESLDSVKDLSDKSSRIFVTLLFSIVFTTIISATTKDSRLLTNTGLVKLPVVNIDAPVLLFYLLTPLILCAILVYFHISLQRLWEAMATLPAIFPNGRRLDEKTPGWLMNDIPRQHIPRLRAATPAASRLQWFVCILLAYWIVPFAILFLWTQSLRLENWFLTGTCIFCFGISVATASGFLSLMDRTLARKRSDTLKFEQRSMQLLGHAWGLLSGGFAAASLLILSYYGIEYDVTTPSPIVDSLHAIKIQTEPSVDNEDISTRPATWTGLSNTSNPEIAATRGMRFSNMRLRRLHASNAFFVKSVFYLVDLTGGSFYRSDLRAVYLDQVNGANIKFLKCDLSDLIDEKLYGPSDSNNENYHGVTINGCDLPNFDARASRMCALRVTLSTLQNANFTQGNLFAADFRSSILVGARFDYANLQYSNFDGISAGSRERDRISFSSATCSHAHFYSCDLSGATFEGANLDDAVFSLVDVSDVNFGRVSMARADLSGATGLTLDQLKKAQDLRGIKVPKYLEAAFRQIVP